jgi:NAD(P)H-hydrate epimerase
MRSGAGLVTLATPASALAAAAARVMPEVMTAALAETDEGAVSAAASERVNELAGRADVIAVGPGLTASREETREFVRTLVGSRARANHARPFVIDADALNSLAPWPAEFRGSAGAPLVLTPHAGEMRRLIGAGGEEDFPVDRVGAAGEFAVAHEVILVLKGERTLVAAPDGRVFVVTTGNPGLGTAGSGDTLTGVMTGFIAQERATMREHSDVLRAVLAAVYVAGLAGDLAARELGMRTMVASDVREHLGAAVRALDPEGERPC